MPFTVLGGIWFWAQALSPPETCSARADTRGHAFASLATTGGDVSHSLSQHTHSATGNPDVSQPSATELIVVSFAVTHMALHNNQELTGTVSFHGEQQRH